MGNKTNTVENNVNDLTQPSEILEKRVTRRQALKRIAYTAISLTTTTSVLGGCATEGSSTYSSSSDSFDKLRADLEKCQKEHKTTGECDWKRLNQRSDNLLKSLMESRYYSYGPGFLEPDYYSGDRYSSGGYHSYSSVSYFSMRYSSMRYSSWRSR